MTPAGGTTTVPDARPRRRRSESVVAAAIFAAATIAVAGIGSLATSAGRDWYDDLDKPDFTPAGSAFGIVWTMLFVVIAISGWLAWRARAGVRATVWWAVQMAFNLAWTAVFFGLESPLGGLVLVIVLIAAVVMNLRAAARVDTAAGVLLFPYLVWCCFAAVLTIGVAVMN